MEMSLIEKAGKPRQTRIKISTAEWNRNSWLRKMFDGLNPQKETSKYKYFVVEGDLLNHR